MLHPLPRVPSPRDLHGSLLHILHVSAKSYPLHQAYFLILFKTETKPQTLLLT